MAELEGIGPEHDVQQQAKQLGGEPVLNEGILRAHDRHHQRHRKQQGIVEVRQGAREAVRKPGRLPEHQHSPPDETQGAEDDAGDVDVLERQI